MPLRVQFKTRATLAAHLSEAETLWNTALVGTPAAARYQRLRDDLYHYIRAHLDDEALQAWLRSQESEHTKDILADVQYCLEWEVEDEQRLTMMRAQRIEEWNVYALTRKLSWSPLLLSGDEKDVWRIAFIDAAWNAAPGYRVIADPEKHAAAFTWLRARHSFPDLQEVIGPPRPDHHLADGSLIRERKRELLLLGLFSWRGFTVAYRRWHLEPHADPFWASPARKKSWQWVAAIGSLYPRVEVDPASALLRPPDAYLWQSLRSVATAWGITAEPKKKSGARRLPRHVICEYCHRYFVSSQTRRVTYKGRPRRFCNEHATLLLQARALQPKRRFKR